MFKELTDKISYPAIEQQILSFWDTNNIFHRSLTEREGKPGFTFYEGPPTANGRPGIHHVMARTLKDLVCRYKTMRGYQVHRKAGWDTHGLPVEIEVEKHHGFKHKEQIEAYGVEKFNQDCRASVFEYTKDWEAMTQRMGYWVDLKDAYVTYKNDYIESVWWAIKRFFDEGMISKGFKIQPYCPRCETPLSSHEVSQGYEDVKDPSVYVKLKIVGQDASFLVWTTTPWTLISNVALAVHPAINYVKISHKGENLILAEERLSILDGEYTIIEQYKGSALTGKEYERLFDYVPVDRKGFYVIEADFVTTTDGSGIVHIAPAFGEDDYQAGREFDLPTVNPVDKSGAFTAEVTDFAGQFVKDADPAIIQNLKSRHILYKKETIVHSYPHCWRCKSPLLYYARTSWYITTTKYAGRMKSLNNEINWIPPEVGTGRFGNWLDENKDWALSRDRYWGTPLPIWVTQDGSHMFCIGSVEELLEGMVEDEKGNRTPIVTDGLDLHKPFMDQIVFERNGTVYRRVPEVIDCWFDSGAMPFAQFHYPFENKEYFEENYPADFICEGIDQTRGWFYTLHAIGTFLFGKPAYSNVMVNELILDKDGQKMSKSRGNAVDPLETISTYGADTVRWFLVTSSVPWRPKLFDIECLSEVQRKFFGTLVNTYSFFALYANIDEWRFSEEQIPPAERAEIDRWILSVLNTMIQKYTEYMDAYDPTRAARLISDFTIDQLSNWYVRRNRRRFWKSENGKDKNAAYQTLYECLNAITKLMAPFAPFLAEEIYRNLNSVTAKEPHDSVHLSLLPISDQAAIDGDLEGRMDRAQRIVYLVRWIRSKSNLKVRQPLRRIIIPVNGDQDRLTIQSMEDVILEEINIKAIEYVTDDDGVIKKRAKPNFKVLGPKFGKQVQHVAARVKEFTAKEINDIERDRQVEFDVNGQKVEIAREDFDILHEEIKGWIVESDKEITVAVDTELNEELLREGQAREFVNKVQTMRKDAGFEVTDRIIIFYRTTPVLQNAIAVMESYIQTETLAEKITNTYAPGEYSASWDVNGEQCEIGIQRL
jgi:isoleucyl-tRNA synthetase